MRRWEMLNKAKRPVILAGNGLRLSNALDDFRELIERLQIPVLTTWKAADILPDDHPLYAGRPGAIGQRGANFTQQNADCLLIVGARLDFGQTAYNHANFAPRAEKIMVDIDPAEIGKMQMKIEVSVVADAGIFFRECKRRLSKLVRKDRSEWLIRCKEWQARYPVVLPEYRTEPNFVNDYVLIDVLSDELTGHDLVIPGRSAPAANELCRDSGSKQAFGFLTARGSAQWGSVSPRP